MARYIGCTALGAILGVALMAITAAFAIECLDCSKIETF